MFDSLSCFSVGINSKSDKIQFLKLETGLKRF